MALPVIFLMGATATGKTDVAVSLFRRYCVDIISVDSAMIYKGMDIGTGKPSKALLQEVPHRLIDICEPHEIYSAYRFRSDALQQIKEIHARQRVPLLVGGSGLYFHVLGSGISDLPYADQDIRQRLEAEASTIGWPAMHQKLLELDCESAARIHPKDAQRIQRALEVYEISGRSMTEHYRDNPMRPLPFKIIKIILGIDDRPLLHERIKARFLQMLDDGLVDELKAFHQDRHFNLSMPAMRLVGYRQVWNYLDGEISYAEMIDKAVIATRQLAKRQITWLRKEENAATIAGDGVGVDEILQQTGYL